MTAPAMTRPKNRLLVTSGGLTSHGSVGEISF